MAKAKSTEIAETTDAKANFLASIATTATGNLPAHIDLDSNEGNENIKQDDLQTPRLKIVQYISDELKKNDPAYMPDAEAGDMFDSVTKGLMKEAYIVNVFYARQWLLWRTRKNQGGLVSAHDSETEAKQALAEICEVERIPLDDEALVAEKFEIVDTPQHYSLLIDPETGAPSPIIIDMPSTKQKVSKQWNTVIRTKQGARYVHIWKVTTKEETNARNEDYFNYSFEWVGYVNEDLLAVAKETYDSLKELHSAQNED